MTFWGFDYYSFYFGEGDEDTISIDVEWNQIRLTEEERSCAIFMGVILSHLKGLLEAYDAKRSEERYEQGLVTNNT